MSDFSDTNILRKIFAVIPGILNPVSVRGQRQRWRDDFNGNSLSPDWEILQIGTGQTITVGNSELTINTGITAGTTIIRNKKSFNIPCRASFIFKASQRIANQSLIVEIVDASGNNYARFLYLGTSASTVNIENSADGSSVLTGSTFLGTTSSVHSVFEIDAAADEIRFSVKDINSVSGRISSLIRNQRIPDVSKNYYFQIKTINSIALSSGTLFAIDSVTLQENETLSAELVAIKNSRSFGDSLGVNTVASSISATISNTPQIANNQAYTTETIVNLGAGGTFTSGLKNTNGRGVLIIVVDTDQAGNLYLDQSFDNVTYLDFGAKACVSGTNVFTINPSLQYAKIRYVNNEIAQGRFRVFSQLKSF